MKTFLCTLLGLGVRKGILLDAHFTYSAIYERAISIPMPCFANNSRLVGWYDRSDILPAVSHGTTNTPLRDAHVMPNGPFHRLERPQGRRPIISICQPQPHNLIISHPPRPQPIAFHSVAYSFSSRNSSTAARIVFRTFVLLFYTLSRTSPGYEAPVTDHLWQDVHEAPLCE